MNMKDNLQKLMQEAQKMQAKMQEAQRELEQMVVTGVAGAGLVKVEMTGKYSVKKVTIDQSALDEEDKEMLEDLVAAAVNDAVAKIEKETRGKMSGFMSGLNLPPGFKSPLE